MITCFLKYTLDPTKVKAFENYGKMWIDLVNRFGGMHHGYLLPHEGASNIGYASFSFPSLADYEIYRDKITSNPDCIEAFEYAQRTHCILHYERSFMKPIFSGNADRAKLPNQDEQ
ncbi:MAG: NIPSNAP family protein [Reichenbachiella sp.]|uniref:NIPSNAP family protein n=1 Tax=Reichenbachiella sp. TaxID=2184521 RepID=UPI003267E5B8